MTEELLDKLTDFSMANFPYTDREQHKKHLLMHETNKTLFYKIDDQGKVIALIRFNARPKTGIGDIIEFAISPEWRRKGLFKEFVKKALETWPMGTHLTFERDLKDNTGRVRQIPISFILQHNF